VAGYDGHALRSGLGLALPMQVRPEFRYLGSLDFVLRNVARVERHHFVDALPKPRRLVIVQFEAFLAGVEDHYRYALRNPRTLGGERWGRTDGMLRVREECDADPEAELARSARFLAEQGAMIGDDHAVARFARIVGDDRRREILIFYHEVGGSTDGILERAESAFELDPG
jgi:hypothetical protein